MFIFPYSLEKIQLSVLLFRYTNLIWIPRSYL